MINNLDFFNILIRQLTLIPSQLKLLIGDGQNTCKVDHSVNFCDKPCIYSLTNIA